MVCRTILFWKFGVGIMNIFYLKWSFPLPHWLFDNIFYLKMVSANLVLRIWDNNANAFYLKTGFPFFGLVMGTSGKYCQYLLFENGISVVFLACDGNLWKIISISSIWKRNFRVFSGLVMGTSFENGISVSFWAFLENNASIFYLKTGFPFFLACDGNLWKIMPISSIWKRDFPFFGLVMGTSGK